MDLQSKSLIKAFLSVQVLLRADLTTNLTLSDFSIPQFDSLEKFTSTGVYPGNWLEPSITGEPYSFVNQTKALDVLLGAILVSSPTSATHGSESPPPFIGPNPTSAQSTTDSIQSTAGASQSTITTPTRRQNINTGYIAAGCVSGTLLLICTGFLVYWRRL